MHFSVEKAILVGIDIPAFQNIPLEESMAELTRLADTAGAEVVGQLTQNRPKPDQRYFIGSGKLEELKQLVELKAANLIIFDSDISASQERNLEEQLGVKVINRTELILDIFAQHAKSREGKLQVALAQNSFLLTRLSGYGVLMSRLGGGIGTRGPGETKLEYDRRHLRQKISESKREIEKIRQERFLRREKRRASHLPLISLVGYTNAGKSTLLNYLTGADAHTEDKLFATLDTTTRRLDLSPQKTVLLTDTVGFIQKLPHHLIAAFRATLEEVTEAELLLHVVDLSHPCYEDQIAAVYNVLEELNSITRPIITVFNKIDKVAHLQTKKILEKYKPAVAISAISGEGTGKLIKAIFKVLFPPPGQSSSNPA
jgi:GTP-binding protein HflX